MTASLVAVLREGVLLALLLVAPLLVAALVAGVVTGLIGAFTQVQDPAVGLVPRVAAVGVALVLFAPSIGRQLDAFGSRLWPLVTVIGTGGGVGDRGAGGPGSVGGGDRGAGGDSGSGGGDRGGGGDSRGSGGARGAGGG